MPDLMRATGMGRTWVYDRLEQRYIETEARSRETGQAGSGFASEFRRHTYDEFRLHLESIERLDH